VSGAVSGIREKNRGAGDGRTEMEREVEVQYIGLKQHFSPLPDSAVNLCEERFVSFILKPFLRCQ
jgi:hypothetical protein